MIAEIIAGLATALATVFGGILAYRGTRKTQDSDMLSKAAGLYSDYADKMEERVTALESDQKDLEKRFKASESEAARYREDAKAYRKIITEVIEWITEILNWETRGRSDPAPHFTLTMVLAHLTRSIKDRTADLEDGE